MFIRVHNDTLDALRRERGLMSCPNADDGESDCLPGTGEYDRSEDWEEVEVDDLPGDVRKELDSQNVEPKDTANTTYQVYQADISVLDLYQYGSTHRIVYCPRSLVLQLHYDDLSMINWGNQGYYRTTREYQRSIYEQDTGQPTGDCLVWSKDKYYYAIESCMDKFGGYDSEDEALEAYKRGHEGEVELDVDGWI